MLRQLSGKWHLLWDSRPGRRFQNYYRRTRREDNHCEAAPRFARIVMAMALLVAGVCLLFFPLVYIPFLLASAALFASESLRLAQLLDRGEAWMRESLGRILGALGVSRGTASVVGVTLGVGSLVLGAFVCYVAFVR
jgi:hypothetical protein